MSRDCTCYIKTCTLCNQNKKPNRIPKACLGIYHAGFPMERVHADILGPFTTSRSGNKYILMMCDQFSFCLITNRFPLSTIKKISPAQAEMCHRKTHTPENMTDGEMRNVLCVT